jgi:sRNA-binding protein
LAEHFPALFGAGRMLPIKLRIQADIQQRVPGVFSKKSLSIFLHRHTTSTAYIKALVNAAHRFDLDGQPAGDIAQEHKDAGVVELERRLAIVMARRAAEREAQRQARRPGAGSVASAGAAGPAADDSGPVAEGASAPPRPPRGDRPQRPPHTARPPRPDAAPRRERPPRQDQAERPAQARPPRPDRARPAPQFPPRPAAHGEAMPIPVAFGASTAPIAPTAPSAPLTPEQIAENEARRARATLLRAFESTTLTRSNFCALKGLKDEVLEAQLVQAREERKLHPPAPSDRERPRDERPRFEDRGPRRDAQPRPGAGRGGRPPR